MSTSTFSARAPSSASASDETSATSERRHTRRHVVRPARLRRRCARHRPNIVPDIDTGRLEWSAAGRSSVFLSKVEKDWLLARGVFPAAAREDLGLEERSSGERRALFCGTRRRIP